jgi:hypothetical protein
MKYTYRFDNQNFNVEELKQYIQSNRKLLLLYNNLCVLITNEKGFYKHVIYASSTSCAKIICGMLHILGLHSAYDKNHKSQMQENVVCFSYLTTNNVYGKPLSKTLIKSIKNTFNERPDNIFGKNIMIMVIDKYFKEGIDLFDVKYMHIFSKIIYDNEENQIIGRIRRTCGHIGLPNGTKQIIYSYFPTPKSETTFAKELVKLCYYSSIDYFELQDIQDLIFGNYLKSLKSNFSLDYNVSEEVLNFKDKFFDKYNKLYINNKSNCYGTFELTPTQKMLKDYFQPTLNIKGILCWHYVGSGKTCLGLGVARNFIDKKYSVIWVSRGSLLKDIQKNVEICYGKDKIDKKLITVSYKTFTNLLQNKNKYSRSNLENTLIIIDEAHKMFDGSLSKLESPDLNILREAIKHKTCKLMLMTATPFIQEPMQVIKLLNLITDIKMPENFEEFSKEYLEDNVIFSDLGINKFVKNIYKNISYLDVTKDNSMFAIQVKNDII